MAVRLRCRVEPAAGLSAADRSVVGVDPYRCVAGGAAVSGPFVEQPAEPLPEPGPGLPHRATRPGWWCTSGCGDWPCGPARVRLREIYVEDPVGLSMVMAEDMSEAIKDLWKLHPDGPPTSPRELFDRFVAWTRPAQLKATVHVET